jgi:hypothetical protein
MFLVASFLIRPHIPSMAILQILVVIVAPVLSFFIPNFVLEKVVNAQQERLRSGPPDALDLMVVCVEAGLGLDQAIMTVSRELSLTHRDISDELSLVNLEMLAGTLRADALRNLAERTGEDELRNPVAILIQTDRFGTSRSRCSAGCEIPHPHDEEFPLIRSDPARKICTRLLGSCTPNLERRIDMSHDMLTIILWVAAPIILLAYIAPPQTQNLIPRCQLIR